MPVTRLLFRRLSEAKRDSQRGGGSAAVQRDGRGEKAATERDKSLLSVPSNKNGWFAGRLGIGSKRQNPSSGRPPAGERENQDDI